MSYSHSQQSIANYSGQDLDDIDIDVAAEASTETDLVVELYVMTSSALAMLTNFLVRMRE